MAHGPDGDPLRLGRTTRVPSEAMLRALRHRDRACAFPSCGARRFAQAHHIRFCSHGGRTDLQNLVLLCHHHHTLVHEHGWGLTRPPGGPAVWFRPDGTRYRAGPAPPGDPQPFQSTSRPTVLVEAARPGNPGNRAVTRVVGLAAIYPA